MTIYSGEKDSLFNKLCCNDWIFIYKKINLKSAINRKKVLIHAKKWMNFENIVFSGRRKPVT